MTASAPFPDRDTVAEKLAALSEPDKSYLALVMENAARKTICSTACAATSILPRARLS
ncbi:hypothetical protein GGE46_000499 [Rhizobium etli]|uniref:Uncharacterized protein n=1 Tax=Rhizobium etli TaxID=29449 RepID=A0A7W6V5E7_RHIET|nr:hypothetical protein [Rhizobium etli]MBB4533790.1 hypothetical protein [Rhizobium etli]